MQKICNAEKMNRFTSVGCLKKYLRIGDFAAPKGHCRIRFRVLRVFKEACFLVHKVPNFKDDGLIAVSIGKTTEFGGLMPGLQVFLDGDGNKSCKALIINVKKVTLPLNSPLAKNKHRAYISIEEVI